MPGDRLVLSPTWRPRIGQVIGHGLLRPAYRLTVQGAALVPPRGPVILVSNHTGFLDGPFVFTVSPRPVHFLVKQETFSGPFGVVLRGVGQIPVDRTVGDRTHRRARWGDLVDLSLLDTERDRPQTEAPTD